MTNRFEELKYNAKNMGHFLGDDPSDDECAAFAKMLIDEGWQLVLIDCWFHAIRDGKEMSDDEWHQAMTDFYD